MKCDRSVKRDLFLKCWLHDYRVNRTAAVMAGEQNPDQYAKDNTKGLPWKRMTIAKLRDELQQRTAK
jgi:hypothetical protein